MVQWVLYSVCQKLKVEGCIVQVESVSRVIAGTVNVIAGTVNVIAGTVNADYLPDRTNRFLIMDIVSVHCGVSLNAM